MKVTGIFKTFINVHDVMCLLNSTCIKSCLMTEYGYSDVCAGCFGNSVACGLNDGVCSLGDE